MDKKVTLTISAGETTGKSFLLRDGNNLVGRWDPDHGAFPEVDLEAHDPEAKVSRRHAIIHVSPDRIILEDVGSLNGTYLNKGEKLEPGNKVELKGGDEVIVGKTFLVVKVE